VGGLEVKEMAMKGEVKEEVTYVALKCPTVVD
jgi:hypothetical protein